MQSADDPQLAEFLQLMQPRRAGTIWSNDDTALAQATKQSSAGLPLPPNQAKQAKGQHKAAKLASAVDNSSDKEEEYQELPSSRDSDASASDSGDEDQPVQDATVLDEGVSDLDYLKSRVKSRVEHQDAEERSSSQTSSLTDTHQVGSLRDAASTKSNVPFSSGISSSSQTSSLTDTHQVGRLGK